MTATLVRVRSWQWLLIGLAVGGLGALSAGVWGEPMLAASYGESINGRREFEDALTRREGDTPWFTELAVHEEQFKTGAGGTRTVHVVTGMYFDGRPPEPGGDGQAVWRPAFFVAEVPYVPAMNVARLPGGGDGFASLPQPTVVDFLGVMSRARGVRFTHAWWRSPRIARTGWLLAGCVGIGILWPLALNLIVFGSIRRPKQAGIDLRKVSTSAGEDGAADHAATIAQLDDAIGGFDPSTSGSSPPPRSPELPAVPSATRPMTSQPLQPVSVTPVADERSFAAGREDFYPTEVKTAKAKPGARKS